MNNNLRDHLATARALEQRLEASYQRGPKISITGVGAGIATAYEQLRNAAEYTDEHLLLQRAVRRFYVRNLQFTGNVPADLGEELITELTQAGYLANNTLAEGTAAHLNAGIKVYQTLYTELRRHSIEADLAERWLYDLLGAETERVLLTAIGRGLADQQAFIATALDYFKSQPAPAAITALETRPGDYATILFIAVHRALIKAGLLTVRLALFQSRSASQPGLPGFIEANREVDHLFTAAATERLTRYITSQGGPWRVLYGLMLERDIAPLLADEPAFTSAYRAHTIVEYERLQHRINRGLLRSIAFLVVSKVILGLAVEVPYDLWSTGVVGLLPLTVNLAFPPVYMMLLGLSLREPTQANATTLVERMAATLFHPADVTHHTPRRAPRHRRLAFNFVFAILCAAVFGGLGWSLARLGFNVVQGIIFFVFLSTASFLGFRLSRIIRELTLGSERAGLGTAFKDALSLPFVFLGQWLSTNYARVNLAAGLLDLFIELPLKTILRLIRQWISFVNEKKDEI